MGAPPPPPPPGDDREQPPEPHESGPQPEQGGGQEPPSEQQPPPQPPPAQQPPPQQPPPAQQPSWSSPAPGAAPPPGQGPPPAAQAQPSNGLAIGALITGIAATVFGTVLGFFILTLPLAFILGVVAVILGILGMRKAKQIATGKGLALTGVITGAVGIVAVILWVFAFGALFSGAGEVFDDDFFDELEELEDFDDDF